MKINGKTVLGNSFAFDGCHKIYICEDENDEMHMKNLGYKIYPLDTLKQIWDLSCPLRFIDNVKLDKVYVAQCEDAYFED